ncbi:MAG: hypothetical protein JNL57_06655 [Bacteroidetes bacterium]|nr:hypothetical protein [Bacteroidota bacterium]
MKTNLKMKNGWGKLRLISAVLLGLFAMGGLSTCKHEPPYLDTTTTNTGVDTICFERDILPLFKTNCAKSGCHDSITQEENMMLNSYNGIRYSKDKGVVPGDPSKSKLIKEIDNGKMNGPTSGYGNLSADQVALIKRWIKEGAVNGSNCRSL